MVTERIGRTDQSSLLLQTEGRALHIPQQLVKTSIATQRLIPADYFLDALTGEKRKLLQDYLPNGFYREIYPTELKKLLQLIVVILVSGVFSVGFRAIENATYELGLQDDYQMLLEKAAQNPPPQVGYHADFDYLHSVSNAELGKKLQETFADIQERRTLFNREPFVINLFVTINQAENDQNWQKVQQRLSMVLSWAEKQDLDVMISFGMSDWARDSHPFEKRFEERTLQATEKWAEFFERYRETISGLRPFYEANSPTMGLATGVQKAETRSANKFLHSSSKSVVFLPEYIPFSLEHFNFPENPIAFSSKIPPRQGSTGSAGIAYGNDQPLQPDYEMAARYQELFGKVADILLLHNPDLDLHASVTAAGIGYDEYSWDFAEMYSLDIYNNYEYDAPFRLSLYNYLIGKGRAYQALEEWLDFYDQRRAELNELGIETECGITEIGRKYSNEETRFWLRYSILLALARGCNLIMPFEISKEQAEWDWGFGPADWETLAYVFNEVDAHREMIVLSDGTVN